MKSVFNRKVFTKKNIPAFILALVAIVLLCVDLQYMTPIVRLRPVLFVVFFAFIILAALFSIREIKPSPKVKKAVFYTVVAISPVFSYVMVEALQRTIVANMNTASIPFNLILYIAPFATLTFVFRRRRYLAVVIPQAIFIFVGVTNMFIYRFRGASITPWDFYALGTSLAVAGRYIYSFTLLEVSVLSVAAAIIIVAVKFGRFEPKRRSPVKRIVSSVIALAVLYTVNFYFITTDVLEKNGFMPQAWEPNISYHENGFLLSFAADLENIDFKRPDGYSVGRLTEFMQAYTYKDKASEAGAKKPNIIVIMNESLSDFAYLNDELFTTEDYLPYISSLSQNTIKGYAHMSINGGGTCNSEYEFLTGDTMAFLPAGIMPYSTFMTPPQYSLVTTLEAQGYKSLAIHPYYGYCWKRDKVYEYLDFDRFIDIDGFENQETIRGFISDRCDYQKVIDEFEQNDSGSPLFIFNVTMQNHGGYGNADSYGDWTPTVSLDEKIFGASTAGANEYLSLVRESDDAFRMLTEYFEGVDEPTVILMWGDHQPALGKEFYKSILGTDWAELSYEQRQKVYVTPYIIWANYDIDTESVYAPENVSCNYLSTILLKACGLQMSPYNRFLYDALKTTPIISAMGYSLDGVEMQHFGTDTETINKYRWLEYNRMIDKSGLQEYLFRPVQ